MIDKIKIVNFRCFKQLELNNLRQFNVMVGPSGTGKTAFLEAIFLAAASSAEVYLRLRRWRGLSGPINFTGSKASFESLFREMFFGFDPKPGARIELLDSDTGWRRFSVGFKGEMEFRISIREPISSAFSVEPILFQWKTDSGHSESLVEIEDGKFHITGTSDVYPIWLISPAAPDNYVQFYSELSKRGKAGPIIEAFCKMYPQVNGLSIESSAGDFSVFADLPNHGEKIPIGMLSAGMSKYFSVLTAIASNPRGVVIIDELESGFYYEALPDLLKSICDFAQDNKVQLIATTHSYELLDGFASAMEGREELFGLLRTNLNPNGVVDIRISRGPAAVSAIRQHLEVR
jgi:AAA domain, putative AbiEii toxin, Type IV TA system